MAIYVTITSTLDLHMENVRPTFYIYFQESFKKVQFKQGLLLHFYLKIWDICETLTLKEGIKVIKII
jgi:hypothetical protein